MERPLLAPASGCSYPSNTLLAPLLAQVLPHALVLLMRLRSRRGDGIRSRDGLRDFAVCVMTAMQQIFGEKVDVDMWAALAALERYVCLLVMCVGEWRLECCRQLNRRAPS